ncbi:MAG: DUF58 domain-containing protein [Candidatus Krumholzibacteriia bacterium]
MTTGPTPRLLRLVSLGLIAAVLPAIAGAATWPIWLVLTVALLTLAGVDAVLLGGVRPAVRITAPSVVGLTSGGELQVVLMAAGGRALPACEVHCDASSLLQRRPLLGPERTADGDALYRLELRPVRRGETEPGPVWLRWAGPLGLMRRSTRVPVAQTVSVLPELSVRADRALEALGADRRLGLLVERFTGEGSEFHQLRDYVPGLDHRRVDWKASARHRQTLVRQLRAERDQQVILAVDCGRLMSVVDARLPKLDHAIDAGLRLALVSLRHGDRVGLYGFAAGPRLWLPPHGGLARFAALQRAAAGLDYAHEETNFTLALAELSQRLTRRALVVVLSDFADAITAELMRDNLRRLARRHLVLCCALRDAALDRVATAAPTCEQQLARAVVADDLRQERRAVLQGMQRLGVMTVDATPRDLTGALLDRYLEIKRRELIA